MSDPSPGCRELVSYRNLVNIQQNAKMSQISQMTKKTISLTHMLTNRWMIKNGMSHTTKNERKTKDRWNNLHVGGMVLKFIAQICKYT